MLLTIILIVPPVLFKYLLFIQTLINHCCSLCKTPVFAVVSHQLIICLVVTYRNHFSKEIFYRTCRIHGFIIQINDCPCVFSKSDIMLLLFSLPQPQLKRSPLHVLRSVSLKYLLYFLLLSLPKFPLKPLLTLLP